MFIALTGFLTDKKQDILQKFRSKFYNTLFPFLRNDKTITFLFLLFLFGLSKIPYEIMDLFEQLYDQGNTIVMVTHEEDIAQYAHRIIRLRDGVVESDTQNTNIRRARDEMGELK